VKHIRTGLFALIAISLCLVPVLAAPNPNPAVAPINSRSYGKSYSEWAQAWWTWVLSIPAAQNPATDETGEFGAVGQSGHVWFLASTLFGGDFDRYLTVPNGTALFFPVFNAVFWAPDDLATAAVAAAAAGLDPDSMTDEQLLQFLAGSAVASPTTLKVLVDGKPLKSLESYRAAPEPFELSERDLLDDFGVGPTDFFAADGYWVLLHPLSAGKHTIEIVAATDHGPFAGFATDVTYHLTVQR